MKFEGQKANPSQFGFRVPDTMRWNLLFEVKGTNLVAVVNGTQQT